MDNGRLSSLNAPSQTPHEDGYLRRNGLRFPDPWGCFFPASQQLSQCAVRRELGRGREALGLVYRAAILA